jgi:hypothetical protein
MGEKHYFTFHRRRGEGALEAHPSNKSIHFVLFRLRFLGLRSIKHSAHVVRTPQTTSLASFSVDCCDRVKRGLAILLKNRTRGGCAELFLVEISFGKRSRTLINLPYFEVGCGRVKTRWFAEMLEAGSIIMSDRTKDERR